MGQGVGQGVCAHTIAASLSSAAVLLMRAKDCEPGQYSPCQHVSF